MRLIASLLAGILLLPFVANAGPCDAHFTFDGSLADTGGSGNDGQFIDASGEPIDMSGEFVPGKIGQALRLDGETTVFSELDLQTETCPQVSVTAWVFLEGFPKHSHGLISTGFGRGPRLAANSTNLSSWGGSNEIRAGLAIRPGIWIFIAGVWDYSAGVHRLYWRHRSMEEALGESKRPPQEGFWIGAYAYGSKMMNRANGILIDDLRVHGKALTEDEVHAIRDAESESSPGRNIGPSSPTPVDTPFCSTDDDCAGGGGFSGACYSIGGERAQCYQRCDVDSDCGDGTSCLSVTLPAGTLDGICSNDNSSASFGSAAAGTVFATGPGRQSDAVTDTLTEHMNENQAPDITYDSEEEGIAAAEAAAARRDQERRDSQIEDDVPASISDAPVSENTPSENDVLRPTGQPTVTGVVAGFSGYNQRPLDLEDRFLRHIGWREQSDRPCYITIAASDDAVMRAESTVRLHERRGNCSSPGDAKGVRFDPANVLIEKLQVCNNNNANRRMKGLRINGEQFNLDGTTTSISAVDSTEHPNCAIWSRAIPCPDGQYATGLVIHSNDASGSNEQIVGLQMICRRVAR